MSSGYVAFVSIDRVPALVKEAIKARLEALGHSVATQIDPADWLESAPEGAVVVTQLLDGSRINALRQQRPDAVLIALLPESTTDLHATALRAGASSAISADTTIENVVSAIEAGLRGMSLLPIEAAVALAARFPGGRAVELSDQELTWLRSLADNKSIESLAEESSYSPRHFMRILKLLYGKLGASSRAEALTIAARRGII